MIDNLIVFMIVCAALAYVWRKWIRPARKAGGCGSGCSSCDSCDTPSAPEGKRVIMMRKAQD